MDFSSKLDILKQIAQGIHDIHSANVAHMDLKLENILRYSGNVFKIIDLESSIDFDNAIDEDVNIKSSLSIMPPEVYLFEVQKMSTAVDIWS